MPRAVLSPLQLQRAQMQQVAVAVQQAKSAEKAVTVKIAAVETNVTDLQGVTAGLDVPNINSKLAEYEDRISALEPPPE